MEWQQLEHFRAVARAEHFTRAAERLAVSQPALSRSIAKLEEELGVRLFDRLGRSIRLNEFGRILLERADRAFAEIENGVQAIRQMNDPLTGTVSLAFLLSLGLNILPEIIGKFNRAYPNVEFRLFQNATPSILKLLTGGEVELCLTGAANDQPGVAWRKLIDEELFAYLPAAHHLASRAALRLDELAAEPFISFKRGYGMRELTERFCHEAGFAPRIAFEGDDVATVVGLVSSGLGVSLIPSFSGSDAAKIKRISVTEPLCRREIGLAWLKERTLTPSVELFRDFVIGMYDEGRKYRD